MLGCLSSGILVDLFSPGFQWKFSEIVNFTGNHWNSDVNFSGGGGGGGSQSQRSTYLYI